MPGGGFGPPAFKACPFLPRPLYLVTQSPSSVELRGQLVPRAAQCHHITPRVTTVSLTPRMAQNLESNWASQCWVCHSKQLGCECCAMSPPLCRAWKTSRALREGSQLPHASAVEQDLSEIQTQNPSDAQWNSYLEREGILRAACIIPDFRTGCIKLSCSLP